MAQIQKEMDVLRPKTDKFVSNALWATAGVLLIFPFFFMDMKDAEKIEYDAYARRYNRLLILAAEKNCDLTGLPAEEELTLEQMVEKAKAEKEKAQEQDSQENK